MRAEPKPTRERLVGCDETEKDQGRTDRAFRERGHERQQCAASDPVAPWEGAKGPNYKHHHRYECDATRQAVTELDECCVERRFRNDLAVAQWPVLAATRPGARCSDECTPKDYRKMK